MEEKTKVKIVYPNTEKLEKIISVQKRYIKLLEIAYWSKCEGYGLYGRPETREENEERERLPKDIENLFDELGYEID